MERYKNLVIIGTSHISIESIREVESVILKEKPGIVALELDKLRFHALMYGKKRKIRISDIKEIGLKGYLFNLLGAWVEKKLGQIVKVSPGSEMKKAALTAKQVGADIALIDQNIKVTLRQLSKEITWREKFTFLSDLIKGFIFRKPVVKFDLRKVPSEKVIRKLIGKVKKDYPSLYKVLIRDRNTYMAERLYNLMLQDDKIVAVIGAGHEKELVRLIKKRENEIYKKRA